MSLFRKIIIDILNDVKLSLIVLVMWAIALPVCLVIHSARMSAMAVLLLKFCLPKWLTVSLYLFFIVSEYVIYRCYYCVPDDSAKCGDYQWIGTLDALLLTLLFAIDAAIIYHVILPNY